MSARIKLLKSYGEKAGSYSWLHDRASDVYRFWHTILSMPAIIMPPATGITLLVTSGTVSTIINYVLSGVSITAGICAAIQRFVDFSGRAAKHRAACNLFLTLTNDITYSLAMDLTDQQVSELLKGYKDRFEKYIQDAPDLPDVVISAYQKQYGQDVNLSRPIETNGSLSLDFLPLPGTMV